MNRVSGCREAGMQRISPHNQHPVLKYTYEAHILLIVRANHTGLEIDPVEGYWQGMPA